MKASALQWYMVAVVIAITWVVYIWLQFPLLTQLAYVVIGVLTLILAVLFHTGRSEGGLAQILSLKLLSVELPIATTITLLALGLTGNFDSPIFALTFVHTIMIMFATSTLPGLIIVANIGLFHLALTPQFSAYHLSLITAMFVVALVTSLGRWLFEQKVAEASAPENTATQFDAQVLEAETDAEVHESVSVPAEEPVAVAPTIPEPAPVAPPELVQPTTNQNNQVVERALEQLDRIDRQITSDNTSTTQPENRQLIADEVTLIRDELRLFLQQQQTR